MDWGDIVDDLVSTPSDAAEEPGSWEEMAGCFIFLAAVALILYLLHP